MHNILIPLLRCSLILPLASAGPQGHVADFFDFEPDIRIFTAHALMNAAGFKGEWRKQGMHTFRNVIRTEIASLLDSSYVRHLQDFYDVHGGGTWSSWASYALLTDGPPTFALKKYDSRTTPYGQDTENSMTGLSVVLADFYFKAHITELWQKHRSELVRFNEGFRPYAHQALNDILSYCRLPRDYFLHQATRIHIEFSPLMSYYTAQTDKVNGEVFLILGPQESEPSEGSFYHEALHHVITPLAQTIDTTTARRFDKLFGLASSDGHIGYSHFDEAFVRTLSCVLSGKRFGYSDSTVLASVTNEYKLGFVLCLAIYEQLPDYEASRSSFSESFAQIIANIDIEKETQRWAQSIKGNK